MYALPVISTARRIWLKILMNYLKTCLCHSMRLASILSLMKSYTSSYSRLVCVDFVTYCMLHMYIRMLNIYMCMYMCMLKNTIIFALDYNQNHST